MARSVRLVDTNELSTSDISYKAPNGKYYSSEEAYNKWDLNKKMRIKCVEKMYDLLNYKSFMKIPSLFYKKLSEWEPYGYDVVLICMNSVNDKVSWIIKNKDFQSETAKILYLCSVFENNMTDALKEKARKERMKESSLKNNVKEIEDVDLSKVGTSKRGHDVSSLLGDL